MTKSVAKAQDQLVAIELGLKVSPFTLVLHRVVTMDTQVNGFVFMYMKDGLIHLDYADTWNEVNGRRIKIKKFRLSAQVNTRLHERYYKRWYVLDGETLYPVHITKSDDLFSTFYFLTDEHSTHQTSILQPMESPCIRRVSLKFHRPPKPGWGVVYKHHTPLHQVS